MIGSNIVERCDVTSSRAIQPLASDVLCVFFFLAHFISVFVYKDFPCIEVKDEEDLLRRRQLETGPPFRHVVIRANQSCQLCIVMHDFFSFKCVLSDLIIYSLPWKRVIARAFKGLFGGTCECKQTWRKAK